MYCRIYCTTHYVCYIALHTAHNTQCSTGYTRDSDIVTLYNSLHTSHPGTHLHRCSVDRVVYVFGRAIRYPVEDVTPTFLTKGVLSTLRHADSLVSGVLEESRIDLTGISQVPVILVPLHFDRSPASHLPSCQRSIAVRPFVTNDFMTGVPAEPGNQLPLEVGGIRRLTGWLT